MEIPTSIKDSIIEIIKESLPQFDAEESKKELLESGYSFIDEDEDAVLVQQIIDFANTPEIQPIANKNLSFCHPSNFEICPMV